jgi:tetratricopeptide (TPR) repeat protein
LLGDEHPDTATQYHNLASNLVDQRNHADAQPLSQKALQITLRLFGENHPDTAASYNNLALNLSVQAKYEDAQAFFQEATHLATGSP